MSLYPGLPRLYSTKVAAIFSFGILLGYALGLGHLAGMCTDSHLPVVSSASLLLSALLPIVIVMVCMSHSPQHWSTLSGDGGAATAEMAEQHYRSRIEGC